MTVAFVLDTNTVASLMKGDRGVIAKLAALSPEAVTIPQPVLAEIAYGIERLRASKKKDALSAQLELVRATIQRAEWTDETTAHFGRIKAHLEKLGRRIEDFDATIAAHALALDATLVTANVEHLARVPGLRIETWST